MMHHWPYMTTGKTGRHGKARHVTPQNEVVSPSVVIDYPDF